MASHYLRWKQINYGNIFVSESFRQGQSEPLRQQSDKAAMYVRMSTDHQKYSTENQIDAIRKYAADNNLEIIATYADKGKSGLKLEGRDEFQRLLEDVEKGTAQFSIILVLDITRWGRFQDADESGHYEYLCHRHGIEVHYVAEQFDNDGSPITSVFKSIKRTMAAEYSRELSIKVHAGQCRLIKMGYRQGGAAGFGLRRMLIDEYGVFKGELRRGEHKSLQTDRVILVPGPEEEQEIVQWMYQVFLNEGLKENDIAASLNRRGIKTDLQREWTRGTVHQVLTNEKYIGNNIFNRVSNKLKIQRLVNTPEEWVRSDGAFQAIVDHEDFYSIRNMIMQRNRQFSDQEMLDKLKLLHQNNGWLSGIVIDEQINMPSSGAYSRRFGSLRRAYQLVGYMPDIDYRYIEINKYLRKLHATVIEDTIDTIQSLGSFACYESDHGILRIHNELAISIVICRCLQTPAGSYRWNIRLDRSLNPDLTIAIRMKPDNQSPLDFYLLPFHEIERPKIRLSENNGLALDIFRYENLETFFQLAKREHLRRAA